MTAENTVIPVDFTRRRRDATGDTRQLFTIKEVGDRCGLPGPVIMQLVPRTWTPRGWMYTAEQVDAAIAAAHRLRREREARRAAAPLTGDQYVETLILTCEGCRREQSIDDPAYAHWLHVDEIDSSAAPPGPGADYCPHCVIPCPDCTGRPDDLCETCWTTGRVPGPRWPRK